VLSLGNYLNKDFGQQKSFDRIIATIMHPLRPAKVPSKVFFGLIAVSGVRPNVCKTLMIKCFDINIPVNPD